MLLYFFEKIMDFNEQVRVGPKYIYLHSLFASLMGTKYIIG